MPNTRETVRALVSAFNVNNYDFNAVKTNFKLQSRGGEDCIVVSFDEGMNSYQCKEYLDSIKRKMVGEFYDAKEGRYEVVLNTGKSIFDVKSFPFNNYKGCWSVGKQGGIEFLVPIDEGVIFNLKSHLAASLAKDVREDMPTSTVFVEAPDKKGYLWLGKFPNKESCKEFEREFLSRMRERYENVPKKPLEVKGNSVYIKDVFDDARFIDSVTRRAAWRIGRDLQADSKSRSDVRAFKNLIMEFINQPEGLIATGFMCAPPLNGKGASILIPVILDSKGFRALTNKEALSINGTFDGAVFVDINGKTQAELPVNGSSGIYGINFYDLQISHCVITKIIESSVINKDHELSIDPELHFRALSPAQSPLNFPTHAGPSGLRTPPKQRQEDTDSGYDSNSPPKKPEGSGSSSGDPSSGLTELSSPTQEFPTPSPDEKLGESPRQESEEKGKGKEESLYNPVNLAGTSKGFWPPTQLSYTTVSQGVSGPSSQSVSAAQNAPAGASAWSQQPNRWSSQGTSGNKWQPLQLPGSGLSACTEDPWSLPLIPVYPSVWPRSQASSFVSKPSSSKGAAENVQVGPSAWSFPVPPAHFSSSGDNVPRFRSPTQVSFSESSSSKGASESMRTEKSILYVPSSYSLGVEDVNDVEHEKQQVSDGCSEAKSQKSESPKKHGGGVQKIKKLFSSPFKKQYDVSLKRHDVGRDTTRSTPETPVTEKPPVSKLFFSFPTRKKAKSNPPSGVTSPTHEGAPGGLKPLTSDERKELRPLLSSEQQRKLDSHSFLPGEEQHLYLTHTPSGKRELSRFQYDSEQSQLLRLTKAQLPDNSSSKKVDRDSGFCSMGSPVVLHKENVSSELKHLQQVKNISEALRK